MDELHGGIYAAFVRQQNLDNECERLRSELSDLSEGEIEEKIKEFQRSKRNNLLYIGFC